MTGLTIRRAQAPILIPFIPLYSVANAKWLIG